MKRKPVRKSVKKIYARISKIFYKICHKLVQQWFLVYLCIVYHTAFIPSIPHYICWMDGWYRYVNIHTLQRLLSVHRSIYRYCSLVFRQFLLTKNYTENNKWKPRNQRIIKIDEFRSVGRCVEYTWYIIWCTTYVVYVTSHETLWDIILLLQRRLFSALISS